MFLQSLLKIDKKIVEMFAVSAINAINLNWSDNFQEIKISLYLIIHQDHKSRSSNIQIDNSIVV